MNSTTKTSLMFLAMENSIVNSRNKTFTLHPILSPTLLLFLQISSPLLFIHHSSPRVLTNFCIGWPTEFESRRQSFALQSMGKPSWPSEEEVQNSFSLPSICNVVPCCFWFLSVLAWIPTGFWITRSVKYMQLENLSRYTERVF